jgi:uncharacterized protein (DUF1501 family)
MARAAAGERKFLFLFASGAWDASFLDPKHDSSFVDMNRDTATIRTNNLTYTGGVDLPNATRFFDTWGSRTAIVRGIDAHSVGHDSGRQLTMTGTSASSYPDWPTLLADAGSGNYPLPHLVFSGPVFPGTRGGAVVRAGGGTLLDLIDGSLSGRADQPAPVLDQVSDAMIDEFVYQQVAAFTADRGELSGNARVRTESMLTNTERSMEIEGRRFEAGLEDLGSTLADQAIKATELMRLGLSRTAMIAIPGGWDTHGGNDPQTTQWDALYEALDAVMAHMAVTPGSSAASLIDEVVIVCLSEFGRTPAFNSADGKDHWPYNSALVIGSGVRGNQVIGATDEALIGVPIDFASGQSSGSGDLLGSEHLGTALMKLGGLDPQKYLPDVQVLEALLA